jgi:choline dehydrogenase-like flavoprotein
MPGVISDCSKRPPNGEVKVDYVVVGSGCGGATAARLLAEAGKEVLILEEGTDRTGRELTQRDGEMYDQLYMDRGGRSTSDLSISVLQGRVLGGGGVINASDVVPISDDVLRFWQTRFGLDTFSPETLAPFKAAALEDLSANPIQPHQENRANALLRIGAEKLGLEGERMQHNRVGCAGLGTCLIGCPANAKRNPRLVSIPKAIAAGANVFIRARAVHLGDADQAEKRITVRALDDKGYHEQQTFTVVANTVILAANPINTVQLLLRSGVGNDHVGKHVSLQPQLPVVARFKEKVNGFRGIPQAYAITAFEEVHPEFGLWGFRIEAIMGTPGIVSSLLPYSGRAAKDAMAQYPHYAASLVLVPDWPSATVGLTSKTQRPRVDYVHREDHKARARRGIVETARAYFAAGAEEVLVPMARPLRMKSEADLKHVDALTFEPATTPWLSAHQQGGVRFAKSAADGAADLEGRVFGTNEVYVFDSSGYPSSSSSHTMTPIITTSRYLTTQLLARAG